MLTKEIILKIGYSLQEHYSEIVFQPLTYKMKLLLALLKEKIG